MADKVGPGRKIHQPYITPVLTGTGGESRDSLLAGVFWRACPTSPNLGVMSLRKKVVLQNQKMLKLPHLFYIYSGATINIHRKVIMCRVTMMSMF